MALDSFDFNWFNLIVRIYLTEHSQAKHIA